MTSTAPVVTLPGDAVAEHHGNHTSLLHQVDLVPSPAQVDAIVVPTSRLAALDEALRLGRDLGCPVVALCSQDADAAATVHQAAEIGAEVIAVDVDLDRVRLPTFATTLRLEGTKFERNIDMSLKRNVGLALARMRGWERICFLDDDIEVPHAEDLNEAAALLSTHRAVGLVNRGFPDNSVVCHANRAVDDSQMSFIGGGALAVPPMEPVSFFPNIYNEDWFFLLGEDRLNPVTATGRIVQKPFDPFADAFRAETEEFGDCLAEGLYCLLDNGGRIGDADLGFWGRFLLDRAGLIEHILLRLPAQSLPVAEVARIVRALAVARGSLERITAELCVDYLDAWLADRDTWAAYLAALPTGLSTADALGVLGLRQT